MTPTTKVLLSYQLLLYYFVEYTIDAAVCPFCRVRLPRKDWVFSPEFENLIKRYVYKSSCGIMLSL